MNAYTVLSLVPRLLDIHGDAQNAQALAARARWAGRDARVIAIDSNEDLPLLDELGPDAIVIGSGFDTDAAEVLGILEGAADRLRGWVAGGVPLLAVGLGWELLSAETEIEAGRPMRGIGLFSGRFSAGERSSGPTVLDSEWGRIVGYGYHTRDYQPGEGERPLGAVRAGIGNLGPARGEAVEGTVRGSAIGTSLRGPILARNPVLADALLGEPNAPAETGESAAHRIADEYAKRTNSRVLAELGLTSQQ